MQTVNRIVNRRGQVAKCEQEALALLRENLAPGGMRAAAPGALARSRSYHCVFGRDAAICALAMVASGDPVLVRGAHASLESLAARQASNGQLPKFVDLEADVADFWYVGCIDSTLWWLIALDALARSGRERGAVRRLAPRARRAIAWLEAQEHPVIRLLSQNEASDWADIMPRSGFVLYTNALWYRVKRLYGLEGAAATRRHFNQLFHPGAHDVPEFRRIRLLTDYVIRRQQHRSLYLSYVNLASWGDEGDVFGNLLAVLFGLADKARSRSVLRALLREKVNQPWPVRAVCEPIARRDPRWRPYMDRHRQNLAHQYHNGGVWTMIGGFWVAALAANGLRAQATRDLARLAVANARGGWAFMEWFHGRTGAARGMPRQSWNAAGFLMAKQALDGKRGQTPFPGSGGR
ncbi:MAG TPA: glycoside hydrolase 100 family protein [Burkholderiales bacterium]